MYVKGKKYYGKSIELHFCNEYLERTSKTILFACIIYHIVRYILYYMKSFYQQRFVAGDPFERSKRANAIQNNIAAIWTLQHRSRWERGLWKSRGNHGFDWKQFKLKILNYWFRLLYDFLFVCSTGKHVEKACATKIIQLNRNLKNFHILCRSTAQYLSAIHSIKHINIYLQV